MSDNTGYKNSVTLESHSNVVNGQVLKDIQGKVLTDMKNAIICSMGPAGSNTLILHGTNENNLVAEYSKDGNKIIKSIRYQDPIEMSIKTEVEEITRRVEKVVGDGTTSAVVLASLIFDKMIVTFNNVKNPFQTTRIFQSVVETIKNKILTHKRDCTLDDIYNIALISTNGNEDLANQMRKIYEDHGMNVFIDVSASLDANSYTKEYDGLTLDCGYSDAAYINTQEGVCRFNHPSIYAFEDPIDTPHMVAFFETIINHNIFECPKDKMVPTIIMAPRISRDMSGLIRKVISYLYSFPSEKYTQKPPLCIITNIDGISMNHFEHISQLCGCKMIRKYIDDKLEEDDQEKGIAPTLDNVYSDFCGTADIVEMDANASKFINPSKMYKKDDDGNIIYNENGYPVTDIEYDNIINFLSMEYKKAADSSMAEAGSLKRQLNALKANMVEFFVGGISVSDRDSLRDLVEDAVLNCRSAAANGVGHGANYEGWRACKEIERSGEAVPMNCTVYEAEIYHDCLNIISGAYDSIMNALYDTAMGLNEAGQVMDNLAKEGCPYNIATNKFDGKVLTSIMSDVTILDTISKIITIMYTSNQALVQAPNLNKYC